MRTSIEIFNVGPLRPRYARPPLPKGEARGAFLRIRLLFLKRFTLPRDPHQARPRASQLPLGEALVPCFWDSGLPVRPKGQHQDLPLRGRGTARRRWMRRGTTLRIVGTMGAEVKHIEKPTLALPLGELSP